MAGGDSSLLWDPRRTRPTFWSKSTVSQGIPLQNDHNKAGSKLTVPYAARKSLSRSNCAGGMVGGKESFAKSHSFICSCFKRTMARHDCTWKGLGEWRIACSTISMMRESEIRDLSVSKTRAAKFDGGKEGRSCR